MNIDVSPVHVHRLSTSEADGRASQLPVDGSRPQQRSRLRAVERVKSRLLRHDGCWGTTTTTTDDDDKLSDGDERPQQLLLGGGTTTSQSAFTAGVSDIDFIFSDRKSLQCVQGGPKTKPRPNYQKSR